MPKVIDLDVATPGNTIHEESQLVLPVKYCRMTAINKYIGCSRSTAYRLIEEAEKTKGFEKVTLSISSGLKLVKLEVLDAYLEHIDGKWL